MTIPFVNQRTPLSIEKTAKLVQSLLDLKDQNVDLPGQVRWINVSIAF